MSQPVPAAEIRAALMTIPAAASAETSGVRGGHAFYIAESHVRAMGVDRTIVVGERGSGKTAWWRALQDPETRRLLLDQGRRELAEFDVAAGFGPSGTRLADGVPMRFPDAATLRQLCRQAEPVDVWRGVLLEAATSCVLGQRGGADRVDWGACVARWTAQPQQAHERWLACDEELQRRGRSFVVLFDALDQLAPTWEEIRPIVRGLLQACLTWLPFERLHTKTFLRRDMLDDNELWGFPDSSKLRTARAMLTWERRDLYALLFHWLGNHPDSQSVFRAACSALGSPWPSAEGFELPPRRLRTDERAQERLMAALASEFMGANARRGVTYSWLPSHLADSAGHVTPRSWLIALRAAAEASARYETPLALHHDAIKLGVVEASRVRVDQIAEDYPWVRTLGMALGGHQVPLASEQLVSAWASISDRELVDDAGHLPPPSLALGHAGWLADLEALHVVKRLEDGRVQMPDIYRLAFGLGRKGGVKAAGRALGDGR
jgi:hypothetical protein